MMDFGSFMAYFESRTKIAGLGGDLSFGKTHVFNLGTDEQVEEGVAEVWEDLKGDMKEGVPMPFTDMTCISVVSMLRNPATNNLPELRGPAHVGDRVVHLPLLREDQAQLRKVELPEGATEAQKEAAKRGPVQKLLIMRVEEHMEVMISWIVYFYGVVDGGIIMTAVPTQMMGAMLGGPVDKLTSWFMSESHPVIKQVAVISHPANYIVSVKPKLTPKESRRVDAGKSFPTQKMPHFVVVDHDVLVHMSGRRGSEGTHASPVPHHRRGHWMRLAERCREARAQGKERVWVRPSYVGDTTFSDLKNDYSVMMDFGRKPELAIG